MPIQDAPVLAEKRNGTINDASCLVRTRVSGVVRAELEEEIRAVAPIRLA
ncbi:MAG: hypothetical protein WD651_11225 [Acidimicrobiia bacterium]